jgi:hypothetical protein
MPQDYHGNGSEAQRGSSASTAFNCSDMRSEVKAHGDAKLPADRTDFGNDLIIRKRISDRLLNLSGRLGGTVVGEPRRKIRNPLSLRGCLGHLEST